MENIKGTTKVCGIIGNPVEHSISPVLQNKLAELMNINLVYVPFKVENNDAAKAVEGAYALNVFGMNVTVPHKSNVIDTLVDIDPLAQSIGAVNTLVRKEGGYKGYNTDILGLKRELEEENINLDGQNVILLGAGGAARAIAFLCVQENAHKVYILNRTIEKARQIADAVNKHFGKEAAEALSMNEYDKIKGTGYVAIQTTSVGLYPAVDTAPIEDAEFYKKITAAVDIIYNPATTRFMELARAQGARAFNGLKMLLYQGVSAFELWNDVKVTKEQADIVYEAMKKEMDIH